MSRPFGTHGAGEMLPAAKQARAAAAAICRNYLSTASQGPQPLSKDKSEFKRILANMQKAIEILYS